MTRKNISFLKLAVMFFFFIPFCSHQTFGQKKILPKTSAGFPVNYDEALVGTYTLPDALTLNDGTKVKDSKTWGKNADQNYYPFLKNINLVKSLQDLPICLFMLSIKVLRCWMGKLFVSR